MQQHGLSSRGRQIGGCAQGCARGLQNGGLSAIDGLELTTALSAPRVAVNPAHLGVTTHKQNLENRAAVEQHLRGAWRDLDKRKNCWKAAVYTGGRCIHVGYSMTLRKARRPGRQAQEVFTHNDAHQGDDAEAFSRLDRMTRKGDELVDFVEQQAAAHRRVRVVQGQRDLNGPGSTIRGDRRPAERAARPRSPAGKTASRRPSTRPAATELRMQHVDLTGINTRGGTSSRRRCSEDRRLAPARRKPETAVRGELDEAGRCRGATWCCAATS